MKTLVKVKLLYHEPKTSYSQKQKKTSNFEKVESKYKS